MLRLTKSLMPVFTAFSLLLGSAFAQKQYGPGVSDREIKIGNIMPYSGPASAYSIIGKTMSAYFRMINDNGDINGRRITFISYDDGYSPPKTVEQARKLVESDEVFLIFAPLGTATNAAIQKYMNTMRVPQLYHLRSDPLEKGDESIFYQKWMADRMFTLVPAQAVVAEFVKTFEQFPPRQKPASFSVGDVLDKAAQTQNAIAAAAAGSGAR